MAPHPEGRRWFQIPLSSARIPRSELFSYSFQDSLLRYQNSRANKHLPVGRPAQPPPPGLLEPWPPAPPPAHSPPQSPRQGAGGARAHRHLRGSLGTRKRVRKLPGRTRPRANRRDAAGRGSPPQQEAPAGSGHVPVLPAAAAGSPEGDASGGQRSPARPVPPRAGRSFEGHPSGPARGRVLSPTDSEDDDLVPLRDMLLAGDVGQQQVTRPDPLANSLESLVREKREQAGLAPVPVDDASSCESPDEDTELPEEQRDILARFTLRSHPMPTVHPGEPVFCARPAPVPTLDTRGLRAQSTLEKLFFCDSPACQAAFVRAGGLGLLYRSVPTCPLPVLRWLFQLMTLRPDVTGASRALREIWLNTQSGERWCPTVREISQVFGCLGANLTPLCHRRLLPPELCPADGRGLDPPGSPGQASTDATDVLALVMQLGDICEFLALCVATRPSCYTDGARLALVTLLSFLGLARTLRCQPLPELQYLLQCVLEGIGDWQEQLPALCQALCQLSPHHHNLAALVQLLPDLTSRGRELRCHLSLHCMAWLLERPPGTVPPPGAHAELEVLGQLLAQAQPDALRQLVPAGGPEDADQEACYQSYSLLLLASNVVGTQQPPPEQRGHLRQLCAQLERRFGAGLCLGTRCLRRAQLASLATLLCGKWQEMLG